MLKFITHKLRNQSLNEVRPIENQGSWLAEHLEELESIGGDTGKDIPTPNERDNGNGNNNNFPSLTGEPHVLEPLLKELRLEKYSENAGINYLTSSRLEVFSEQSLKEKEPENDSKRDETKENQPCFLPVLEFPARTFPSSTDKRKLTDFKRRKVESSSDSSSSDDELKELCSYSSAKLRACSRPPDKIAAVSSSFVVCQRRRNRGPSPRLQTMPRPSINFERMQQTMVFRKQRSRVVRVRTLPSMQAASRHCDPSVLGFKPITNINPCINHLAPVEDPLAF
ncbi:uncharacterized protein LOC135689599 isoform X2 [Rhopilema esculentum]|uniref:uncharacterized protein LOC135689599 isoform X2 n=1 Tax=Rhopilema esculentum TaxID=499914 RepID=UPI0031DB2DDF